MSLCSEDAVLAAMGLLISAMNSLYPTITYYIGDDIRMQGKSVAKGIYQPYSPGNPPPINLTETVDFC